MKNMMLIMMSTLLGAMMLLLVMIIYGRIDRSMELNSNLPSAVEETVENLIHNRKYVIQNEEEFVADFVESFIYTLDAKSDILLDIWQCDVEKGILSVKVSAKYQHPNGRNGRVTCERTVILEEREMQEKIPQYKIVFYVGADIYKIYQVEENSVINAPANPYKEGKIFLYWLNEEGIKVNIEESVTKDSVYYAAFSDGEELE